MSWNVVARLGLLKLFLGVAAVALAADPDWIARGRGGMVAADSPEASRIGADVLAGGGNAFDAAVATSLALAVARPQSTGLGGGGFMVAYVAQQKRFIVLDFREVAPAGATAQRYAELFRERGDGPSPAIYGGNAIGVPGQVAGLAEILRRWGTRTWKDLMPPVARLAEEGFTSDAYYVDSCREALEDMDRWPVLRERYFVVYETLLGSGTPPPPGTKVRRPELARALTALAERGPEEFYRGAVGEAMAKAAQGAGGTLSMADLAAYRVRERSPLIAAYHGCEIVTMPPPSSGGICILETLNVLDALASPASASAPTSAPGYQPALLLTALKHGFADRARWLGDPEFVHVPVRRLTSKEYARSLAARGQPASNEDFGSQSLPDDGGTSHFCVADREGNIVSLTETINGYFGSLVIAEPYGILLNNQMDDFTAEPGKPNLYGLIQSERNAVAPGKRPLSSMSPTIVLRDGRPVLVLGGSGGPRIITAVLQVLLNVVDRAMPLEEALAAVRMHHQWLPDVVKFDRDPPAELSRALEAAGFTLSDSRVTGVVQAIEFLPDGTMVGGSDPRKGGRPAGVEQ